MKRGKVAFEEVRGVSPQALAVLHAQGFRFATPVQAATIPLFSGHKDVAVDAATGSGKTLAFVLPLVEKLRQVDEPLQPHQVGAVVVSPTRELAKQIHAVAQPFLDTLPGIAGLLLVGGTDPAEDVARFRAGGGQVLIGTPGRLADFMRRCSGLDARRLEVLVLDEADRLLDMGFQAQLDAIMARLPRQRRTGLFSATQTEAVEALARAGLRNPVRVNVAVAQAHGSDGGSSQKTPSSLDIQYLICESTEKLARLVSFLQEHPDDKSIVYFLTCACVDLYASLLAGLPATAAVPVQALHGRMKQAAREATLATFAAQPAGCLLCTDVAARGLDIPHVRWVVQFDAPQDPAAFVHRVGRTARMGRSGRALAFLLPHEASYVDFLRLRKVPLSEAEPAAAPHADALLRTVRAAGEADRAVMEKATRAFVSYVRGYKEHHCKFIFRVADLDFGRLAMAMGLLRVPRMAEITHASITLRNFTPSAVDPDTVKFADKQREKQRQKSLADKASLARIVGAQADAQHGKGSGKQKAAATDRRLPAAKRRLLAERADADDMSSDYALLRKLKRGKLTEADYDELTGLQDTVPAAANASASAASKQKPGGKQEQALPPVRQRTKIKKTTKKRLRAKSRGS